MAENNDQFATLLGRIGINPATVLTLTTNQGISNILTLVDMINESQVKNMAKLVSYGPRPAAVVPEGGGDAVAPQIFLSAVSATKLHAVWYWGQLRQRCGRLLTSSAQTLTNAEITRTIERINFEAQAKEAGEEGAPKKPFALKKIEKFNEWVDSFNAYMYSIRGAARIPLPYVYRNTELATDEMRAATYESTDEEFMALFALRGSYYDVDNERVFNELMQFVLNGPGESIIKPFRTRRNGRGAMLALQAYANGNDAIELRASNAYQVINGTVYKRQSKNFTLDDFFARLRDAYSTLAHDDVNQPVQELRKWTETLDKIQDPQLNAAKLAIKTSTHGDDGKTFETLASKVKELAHEIYKSRPQDRSISSVDRENTDKKSFKDSELHAGNWTNNDWKSLTPEQKKRVAELRNAKKKRDKKRSAKAAEAKRISDADDATSSDDDKEQAGKQFGKNAHKKTKKSSNRE